MSTPIQQELESIKDLNSILQQTLNSLNSVSNNIHVLNDNIRNSNKLNKIYTDILFYNKELNDNLQSIQQSNDEERIDIDDLDNQLINLEKQKELLQTQLSQLRKKSIV